MRDGTVWTAVTGHVGLTLGSGHLGDRFRWLSSRGNFNSLPSTIYSFHVFACVCNYCGDTPATPSLLGRSGENLGIFGADPRVVLDALGANLGAEDRSLLAILIAVCIDSRRHQREPKKLNTLRKSHLGFK